MGAPREQVSSASPDERGWLRRYRRDPQQGPVPFAWQHVPTRVLPWLLLRTSRHSVWLGIGVLRPLLFVPTLLAASALCLSEHVWPKPLRACRLYRRLQNDSMRFDNVSGWLPRRYAQAG